MSSIPVICDRCRATGFAGESDFTHLGDLLAFTPVPRLTKRADGWTPERQRAFIAALSATGSKRQAVQALGMAAYGVDQLLKADGSDSFKAAVDRAMLIAQANGSMKIAQGVADAAARNAQLTPPSRLRGLPPPEAEEPEEDEDRKWELLEGIGVKFMRKVAAERQARLAGEIVAADFYLRQITVMEVMLDLLSAKLGFDANEVLRDLRRGDHALVQIAATTFSDSLDRARRAWWADEGAPNRPPYPDPRFLTQHRHRDGNYAVAVDQSATGATTTPARGYTQEEWAAMGADAQWAAREKQFEEDAVAQAQWERRAHAEWEERQG
ncbi:hypothetical protein H9L13_02505 [Sphingomonas lutea]|uniref:Uncharacterized protein n=1 Tax=Sphingomonas lutea TaxID=1045317 RepID=A0A7G9SIZ5_9SPHN|nr:hypothetical protein [Sphingomonas lutea]QNN67820.1 hypothetical protein H9L13_02505 [Sphingomonas lutea]